MLGTLRVNLFGPKIPLKVKPDNFCALQIKCLVLLGVEYLFGIVFNIILC